MKNKKLEISIILFLLLYIISSLFAQSKFYYPEGHFSFNLPSGWEQIRKEVIEEYVQKLKAPLPSSKYNVDLVFQKTTATHPFELPCFLIGIEKGEVNDEVIKENYSYFKNFKEKDSEKIFKDTGLDKVITRAKFDDIFYLDEKKHIIIVPLPLEGEENQIIGVTSIIFYKEGIIKIFFYGEKGNSLKDYPLFQNIVTSLTFDKGYEYKSTSNSIFNIDFSEGTPKWIIYLGGFLVIILFGFLKKMGLFTGKKDVHKNSGSDKKNKS